MIDKDRSVDERVQHRSVRAKKPSNGCGDNHLMHHKSPSFFIAEVGVSCVL
jgi:hypothetical protein